MLGDTLPNAKLSLPTMLNAQVVYQLFDLYASTTNQLIDTMLLLIGVDSGGAAWACAPQ